MTYPGSTTFPGPGTFPGSGTYAPGTFGPPYLSVGAWSSTGVDENGNRWTLRALSGWDEPPPIKGGGIPRPNADGSFDGDVFDDARVITWSGLVVAPARLARESAKRKLSLLARQLNAGAVITAHMDDGDYTVTAKRASGWMSAPFGPLGFRYQAVVTCTDPYKYGPAATSTTIGLPSAGATGLTYPLYDTTGRLEYGMPGGSGQVTVANPGTADTWPLFRVGGPVLGGVSLTDTASGRTVRFLGDVPAGATLTLDAATGRADLNGSDRTGLLSPAQWWPIPAEGASTIQFATAGVPGQAGTLTVTTRPAYE